MDLKEKRKRPRLERPDSTLSLRQIRFGKDVLTVCFVVVYLLICAAVLSELEQGPEKQRKQECHTQLLSLHGAIRTATNLTTTDRNAVLALLDEMVVDCDPASITWTFNGATFFWWTIMSTVLAFAASHIPRSKEC